MNRKEKVYTVRQLATELKISPRTVLRAVQAGELKTVKFSAHVFRLEGEDVDAWLETLKKIS